MKMTLLFMVIFLFVSEAYPVASGNAGIGPRESDTGYANVVTYGADISGTNDSRTAINTANATGLTLLFPAGTYKISSDITITQPCVFLKGAILTPDTGDTVIVQGTASAGNYQIVAGDGTVQFKTQEINTVWYTTGGTGVSGSKWTGPSGQGGIGEAITANLAGVGTTSNADIKFVIPTGYITVTSTILINRSRSVIEGAGIGATNIYFASTSADDVLFDLSNTVFNGIYFGKLSGMSIYDSTAGGLDVVAIQPSNVSLWVFEDIAISAWDGIGIKSMGRELCTYQNIRISADQPIQISQNPWRADVSSIDIDATIFRDCYLSVTTAGNYNVLIDTGVNLTNVEFSGRQNWIGDGGLMWADTTATGVSKNLVIKNVKHESETDATKYLVYISHNSNLQNLIIENVSGGGTAKGFYFRKVFHPTIKNCYYVNSSNNEALNVDSTVRNLTLINNFWQSGITTSITGQDLLWGTSPIYGDIPAIGYYQTTALSTGAKEQRSDIPMGSDNVSIADNGTDTICSSSFVGFVVVTDNLNQTAMYQIKGGGNAVSEVSDPDADYTVTKDNAGTTNIYYDSGYKIQNKTGGTRIYTFTKLGRQ